MRPWTEKAESRFPPGGRLVEFLASVVLVSGMMVLSIGVMIFGIGFGVWLGLGEYDRVNFAIAEGSPFFVLATLFFIAAFGISRFQLWAWWLGLLGSIGGLAHGVYRFFCRPPSHRGSRLGQIKHGFLRAPGPCSQWFSAPSISYSCSVHFGL